MATGRMRYGRCKLLFLLAVGFDLVGLVLILIGIFANLQLAGRSFGDFLIYGGGIILFFSLLWWLAWYSGNLEVSLEELEKGAATPQPGSLKRLARKFSESFSKRKSRRKTSLQAAGKKDTGLGQHPAIPNLPGEPLDCHVLAPINSSVFPQLESPTFSPEGGSTGHLELNRLRKLDSQHFIILWPKEDRLV